MIDIMLPFWGEPRYLYETVEAVRGQTSDDWRLTVVDTATRTPRSPSTSRGSTTRR